MNLLGLRGRDGASDGILSFAQAVVFMLCCCASLKTGESLQCHCTECDGSHDLGHIWGTCLTDGACYTKVMEGGVSSVQRGCVSQEGVTSVCDVEDTSCCHSDRCNGKLMEKGGVARKLLQQTEMTSESMHEEDQMMLVIAVTVSVAAVVSIVAVTLIFTFCCLYFYRGNHRTHTAPASVEAGRVVIGNCCSAIIPQSETLSSLLTASHSPTDSAPSPSLSLLVQRAIVKNTQIEWLVESGRYCDLHLGHWRRERVLVKVYPPKHEGLWFAETQIHQIPHMHHPHLLTFIGADYLQTQGQLRHYLITEHHDRGSLSQYLREAALDPGAVVVLAQSAACGLAHLHLEVKGQGMEKPSIVHRNVSSRSFYVKNDGTCCLGDLSLAVKDSDNFLEEVKGKPLGHTLYLSPEVLEHCCARGRGDGAESGLSCDQLKKADVYALGLVMWEIARRCYLQGFIQSAEVPFSSMVSSEEPSLEKMRQLVCSKQLRPHLEQHWNQDETMQSCVQVMTECWQTHPSNRPSAMSAKNSLDKLLPSVRLTSKNTKF